MEVIVTFKNRDSQRFDEILEVISSEAGTLKLIHKGSLRCEALLRVTKFEVREG